MKPESIVKILQIVLEDVTEGKYSIIESKHLENAITPKEVVEDTEPPVKDVVKDVPVVEEPEEKAVEEVVEPTPVEENEVEEEDIYAKKADELKDKTVAELRTIAREMGLPVRGSKSAILGRIVEALAEQEEEVEQVEEPVEEEPEVTEEAVEETEDVEEVEKRMKNLLMKMKSYKLN